MTGTSTRARNPRGEGDRLREQLMDAAADLLRQSGDARAVSVRGVTARAGVSPTALYLHFSGVDELLAAVLARSYGELRRYLHAAEAEHEGDPDAQLRAMGRAYVAFALERPGHYATIFGPRTESEDIGVKPQVGLDAFDDLVRAVSRCIAGDRDPHLVATAVWTSLHGIVTLRHAMPAFPWPPLEQMLDEGYAAHVRPR
jgi:AcrR family transcriptional regulator